MRAMLVRPTILAAALAASATSTLSAQSVGAGTGEPAKPAGEIQAPDEPRAIDALPEEVATIFARNLALMGGAEAMGVEHWSMSISWTRDDRTQSGKIVRSGSDKFRYDESRGDAPSLVLAENGEFFWTVLGGKRAIRIPESRVEPRRRWGGMHVWLADLTKHFRSFELGEEKTIGETPCDAVILRDKIKVTDVEPYGKYIAYYAKETGRLVALECPGDRRAEGSDLMRFEEWTTAGDLNLFTVVKITHAGGAEETVRYADFSVEPVDATLFEVPEPVRNTPAPRKPGDGPGSMLGTGR